MTEVSEFDAAAGRDAGGVGVLDRFHFGDEVGGADDLAWGAAAGEDEFDGRRSGADEAEDLFEGDELVAEGIEHLVEDDEAVVAAGDGSASELHSVLGLIAVFV